MVANIFFEDSTRTRVSFEIAAKRLGASVVNLGASGSSASKGETLVDTARNIEAMGVDCLVIRTSISGGAALVASSVACPVVNAGDGRHQHPTQALLDVLALRLRLGDLAGKRVAIVGDIVHSRVARSNIHLLNKLGAQVRVVAPSTLLPSGIANFGVEVHRSMDSGLRGADVVMMLRLQLERMTGAFVPSIREYYRFYGLNAETLKIAKPDAMVMHPGPMNRGIEIEGTLADSSRSVITKQVTNGVAVRMAALYLLADRRGVSE